MRKIYRVTIFDTKLKYSIGEWYFTNLKKGGISVDNLCEYYSRKTGLGKDGTSFESNDGSMTYYVGNYNISLIVQYISTIPINIIED
jgi:hypothetical protein